ncbi:MAG: MATE family efflux transporter [Oscillospiraceae bacterium]
MVQEPSKTFTNDFTTGPVFRKLVTFAIPLFLSNLLQAVYSMVDMAVVGQVVGETGLSGLTVGGDVLSLLTFLCQGFAGAGEIIIAQYLGARLRDRLSRFIGTMVSFMFLCAVGVGALCLLLRRPILSLMNTPAEAWDQALSYATTCMCGLIFIYGYNTVSAILRGMGDSKRPFLFITVASVINLILDLVFVAGFGWEAFGAALATVIAQAVSFLTSLIYLYRKREQFGFALAPSHFRIRKAELVPLVKLGVPMAIRYAAILFSRIVVNAWINDYGVTVSAVSGIASKVDMVGINMGHAVATASSAMVGQNIGAENHDRVKRVLKSSFLLNAICFSIVILVIVCFPRTVFGIFTGDPNVLLVCMEYVPVSVTNLVCSALRDSMNGFASGCGNYKFNFAVAIMDGVVGRIGLSFLLGLALGLGYFGFWMGSAIAGVVPFILGSIYYLSGRWKKKSALVSE